MLADLLTLHEAAAGARPDWRAAPILPTSSPAPRARNASAGLAPLRPLTIAYVGDPANVLHDMLVAYPRLGHTMRVASPPAYRAPAAVWDRLTELGIADAIHWSADPAEAVRGADIVVTDTWISMGQEAEKAERLRAFQGYQITEALCANAAPNWAFMHCLPRKPNEVDDEVCVPPLAPSSATPLLALTPLPTRSSTARAPSFSLCQTTASGPSWPSSSAFPQSTRPCPH